MCEKSVCFYREQWNVISRDEMVLVLYSGFVQTDFVKGLGGRYQSPKDSSDCSAVCTLIPKCRDGSEGILNAEQTIEIGTKSSTRDCVFSALPGNSGYSVTVGKYY